MIARLEPLAFFRERDVACAIAALSADATFEQIEEMFSDVPFAGDELPNSLHRGAAFQMAMGQFMKKYWVPYIANGSRKNPESQRAAIGKYFALNGNATIPSPWCWG